MKTIKLALCTAAFLLMSGFAMAQSPVIDNTGGSMTGGAVSSVSGNKNNINTGIVVGSQGGTPSGASGPAITTGSQSVNIQTPRHAASAIAPNLFPTVTCFKGVSVAGQAPMFGFSVGAGKIDHNCEALEVARSFAEVQDYTAYCKVMLTNKYVKQAGVTMEDCLDRYEAPAAIVEAPQAPQAPSITVNVPAPQVTVEPAPVVVEQKSCPIVGVTVKRHLFHKKRVVLPCGQANKK